jgi:hypothetical protein
MRLGRIITLSVAALMAAPVLIGATDNSSHPFTITINAHQENVRPGEEIRVHIVLTNVSDQPLVVLMSPNPAEAELHYTVFVHDQSGKNASETDYGRRIRLRQLIGSDAATVLKPGEKLEELTVLTKVFDLSAPGEYEVQLSRPVSEDSKDGIVKSNKITVAVRAERPEREADRPK